MGRRINRRRMAIDGDPCLKSISDLPWILTPKIQFGLSAMLSWASPWAVSQTFHCITAEQRDNNFNVRVLAVSVPSIPFAWRFIIRVAATRYVAAADRWVQFLWSGIENEKEIAIVSKDKVFTSESCDSNSVWCPLRVVNHRFPNFERLFHRNTV